MEKECGVVVAAPSPIGPLKAALSISVIHSMPGAQCRGPWPPGFLAHRPSCA